MVAVINYGASIYGAVSYNQEKVDAAKASVIHTNRMVKNLDGPEEITLAQTLRSFEDYLAANKRTKKPVTHISLNPSPEDKLSDAELSSLAETYMERMGYGEQPYIVYKHRDIEREHIHIVAVRVDESGSKISDSKDWERSMKTCRDLEKMFGLKQVNDKQEEVRAWYLKKACYEKGDIKRQVSNLVKTLSKDFTFRTFGEYNALLSCFNVHSKIVRGEEEGHIYNGMVYSVTNEKGEICGSPMKSSRIGKFAGYGAINILLRKNVEKAKKEGPDLEPSKRIISACMRQAGNKEEFLRLLNGNKMEAVFRTNEDGRIYGVTFINFKEKTVFNGSRLGKEFSANAFNGLFAGKTHAEHQGAGGPATSAGLDYSPGSVNHPVDVDDIFGTFYLPGPGYDAEEEEFARRMKRKKKKRRRRL